jgi:hypothetical protein
MLNAQLDASWSAVPLSVEYLIAGEIRVIARANDSPRVQNETVRVNAVNANFLDAHRSTVIGFLKTYKKSIDWAFSGEPACKFPNQGYLPLQFSRAALQDQIVSSLDTIMVQGTG